jgi:uncharacterized protein (DUF39 family)
VNKGEFMAEVKNGTTNGNGCNASLEVLAERIANVSKKLDEQIALSKTSVDAALTAINVAKSDQERTVTVAFAANEKATTKIEESLKESNRAISILQNDVVSLKESRSQSTGNSGGQRDMYGWLFGGVMFILTLVAMYLSLHR